MSGSETGSNIIYQNEKKKSKTRDSVSSGYPNTEKRVENTMHSKAFLTEFKMFG